MCTHLPAHHFLEALRVEFTSSIGRHAVAFRLHEDAVPVLRVTSWIIPEVPLLIPFFPRDL